MPIAVSPNMNNTPNNTPRRYAQTSRSFFFRANGFSLVDVLVALTILSIGLLGVAALQFMSKRSNFEAVQRTAASMLAQDIIERMRANYGGLTTYAGTLEDGGKTYGNVSQGSTDPNPCTSSATQCGNADQTAKHDLWEWEQTIDGAAETMTSGGVTTNTGGLVLPTACIYSKVSGGAASRSGNYVVTIAWRGSTELSDPANPTSPAPAPDPYACGRGSGKYNGPTGAADTQRRVLVIETFINAG